MGHIKERTRWVQTTNNISIYNLIFWYSEATSQYFHRLYLCEPSIMPAMAKDIWIASTQYAHINGLCGDYSHPSWISRQGLADISDGTHHLSTESWPWGESRTPNKAIHTVRPHTLHPVILLFFSYNATWSARRSGECLASWSDVVHTTSEYNTWWNPPPYKLHSWGMAATFLNTIMGNADGKLGEENSARRWVLRLKWRSSALQVLYSPSFVCRYISIYGYGVWLSNNGRIRMPI